MISQIQERFYAIQMFNPEILLALSALEQLDYFSLCWRTHHFIGFRMASMSSS